MVSTCISLNEKIFMRKYILTVLFVFLGSVVSLAQNSKKITGVVLDEDGLPIPGVAVLEKGTNNGVLCDLDGKFDITADSGALLEFSCMGYATETLSAKGQTNMKVVLREKSTSLDDVVVVGYRTVKKESLTGAVSNITSKDIVSTKSSSLAVSLAGKVAGFNIRQNSGQPGTFDTSINIRGLGTPLFIIDGIVRDGATEFQRLNAEDIESVSFLKDGTAAIYGMNSSNGAVIVTTKKGSSNQKMKITLSSNIGLSTPTSMPEMCNAAQWYELMVDAQVNNGNSPYITKEELDKWREGGAGYESYDYYDELFKKVAVRNSHTLSFSGGSDKITYFGSLGYTNDGGMLKMNDTSYDQYSIRSNVHAKVTDNLSADINLYGMTGLRKQGLVSYSSAYFTAITEPPITSIYANDNPDYYNLFSFGLNPVAGTDNDLSGYDHYRSSSFQSLVALTWSLPWVKGLDLRAQASYDRNDYDTKVLSKEFDLYTYDKNTGAYNAHTVNSPSSIYNTKNGNDRLDWQLNASYNRKFEKHDVGAVFVFEGRKQTSSSLTGRRYYDFYTIDDLNYGRSSDMSNSGYADEARYLSYIGRFNYGYSDKYLLELAFRVDGSYRYSSKGRYGFFPMGSLGWKVSEEDFVKRNAPWLTNLKLRASYGVSGEDAGNAFQYIEGYKLNNGGYSFSNGSFTSGIATPDIINPNLTWYTSRLYDVGFDLSLWKGLFGLEFDLFQRDRSGLLATRNVSIPNTFGATIAQENLNSDRTHGFEISLSHDNNFGEFFYSIKGNVSLARTQTRYVEEGTYNNQYDRWRNQASYRYNNFIWGYVIERQFTSEEDIATAPLQDGTIGNDKELPGDFKIKDINGDGHIDSSDSVPLFWGNTPICYYGLTLQGNWRGLDFNVLFQGAGGYTIRYLDCLGVQLYQYGNTPSYFLDRWHLSDPYDETSGWVAGTWPAVRPDGAVGSLNYTTSIWRRDATYLRLKSLEIGYSLPKRMLEKTGISGLRLYFNGNNLLTFCDEYVKIFDPEKTEGASSAGLTYPLPKSFNFGLELSF